MISISLIVYDLLQRSNRKTSKEFTKKIRKEKKDITDDYHDRYYNYIGCALAHEYGKEEGLRLFHLVSMHSKKYYPTDCDEQFAKCLRSRKIGIETFLWICKKHGVTFK